MAGCARSGFRQLILLAAVFAFATSATAAQSGTNAPPRAQPPQQGNASMQSKPARTQTRDDKTTQPDAALIEYLGEFDDAADGLDAMGLSESDAPPAPAANSGGH